MARRSDQPLLARFDGVDEPVDFLADINPGGERESTGVVTRFSVRPQKGPPGFPVCLRLLSEIDIIKVIVNSYFLDGDQKKTTLPEPEAINASLSEAQKRAENSQPRDNQLTTEDVWDIQEYFERTFDPRAIEAYRSLWDEAAVLAPRLSLPDRAEMFGLLWGNLEPLTGLYRQLTATLEKLEFTTEAFCPMSALLPRTQSIIEVQTLSGLGKPDQPKLEIQSENGKTVAVDRPIVTALIAELHITMSEQPWPFFANTDLLDFPGARPRQPVDLVEYLAESEKDPLKELLLRGKVAYLFERYVAEQELTSMLLCVRPSNQDVVDLPEMIDKWVAVSHGSTPQSRVGKTIVLFLILTWFDTHFVEKGGDEKADPGERFKSRIYSSIESFFAKTHKWPEDWTPGEPFKNTYWLRNPEYPAESIIVYDEAKREVELRSDKTDYIQSLREGYLSVPSVEKYFREPARAFDEALKLNDGGVGYLANNLGPVCLPELRVEQTVSRIETLCGQVQHLLSQFHVSDDFETRLAERREITNHILQHIQRLGTEGRFANLLRALQISQHGFSGVLYDFYTRRSQDGADDEKADSAANTPPIRKPAFSGAPPLPNAPPLPGTPPLPGSSVTETQIEQPSEVEDSATKNSRSANPVSMNLARAAVEYWMNVVRTKSESDFLGGFFEGDTQLSLELVNELSSAARRLRLDQEVCAAIDRLSGTINEGIDVTIEKAAFASSTVVNRFVSRLHFDQRPESERPVYPTIDGTEGRIFSHPKAANGAAEIDLEPSNQQYDALAHWMYGFHQLVTDNAEAIDGSAVNREQNAALGEILKSIADAVSLTKDDPAS